VEGSPLPAPPQRGWGGGSFRSIAYLSTSLHEINHVALQAIHFAKQARVTLHLTRKGKASEARPFTCRVQVVVGCSLLSDDQQSHVWNDIEDQKDDFEQPEEQVNDHVVSFSGNGEQFALYAIHNIRGKHKEHCPQNEDAAIYDCAPHEERRECMNIHDVPPLSFCIQQSICRKI